MRTRVFMCGCVSEQKYACARIYVHYTLPNRSISASGWEVCSEGGEVRAEAEAAAVGHGGAATVIAPVQSPACPQSVSDIIYGGVAPHRVSLPALAS